MKSPAASLSSVIGQAEKLRRPRFTSFAALLVIWLFGCSPKPSLPAAPTSSLVLVTPLAQGEIKPAVTFTNFEAVSARPLKFNIYFVTVPEAEAARLGLQSLFESPPNFDPAITNTLNQSPVAEAAREYPRVSVDFVSNGARLGKCSPQQLSMLIRKLKQQGGASLIGPQDITIEEARKGVVRRSTSTTVAVDVHTNSGVAGFTTTNLDFGVSVNLSAKLTPDGSRLQMQSIALEETFKGYQMNTPYFSKTSRLPSPIFRAEALVASTLLGTNETLVLAGSTRTNNMQFKSGIVGLSALPRIGSWFSKTRSVQIVERSIFIIEPAN